MAALTAAAFLILASAATADVTHNTVFPPCTESPASLSTLTTPPGASVKSLPGGGHSYSYHEADGTTVTFPVPPQGFKPTAATGPELARYGFPPRPSDSKAMGGWRQLVDGYRSTAAPSACESSAVAEAAAPSEEEGEEVEGGAEEEAFGSTDYNSLNWAGFATHDANGNNHWVAIQGDFSQPNTHSDSCSSSQVVNWVGIGGLTSESLIQAGTGIDSSNTFYAWYEYLKPGGGVPIIRTNLGIHPGNHIHTYVSYERSNNKATFYLLDGTTGGSRSIVVENLGSNYYDGTSGEFIDERPSVNGSYSHLKNFENIGWYNAQVYTVNGAWEALGSPNHERIHMVVNGTTLAAPGYLQTGTSFQDNWFHCHG